MGIEKWSAGNILARITQWDARHGAAPTGKAWSRAGSDEDGSFPSEATVKAKFNSWNAAILAAGLEPRQPGRPTGSTTTPPPQAQMYSATPHNAVVGGFSSGQSLSASGQSSATWGAPAAQQNSLYSYPNNYSYPYGYYGSYHNCVCWSNGAQKKLDALKAVLAAEPGISNEVLLAIIEA